MLTKEIESSYLRHKKHTKMLSCDINVNSALLEIILQKVQGK